MKREILCEKCAENKKKLFPSPDPYPGGHVRFVDGKAKFYNLCDDCMMPLPSGTKITAVTIFTDTRPYHEWESGYLETSA